MTRRVLKITGILLLVILLIDIGAWQILDRRLPQAAPGLTRAIQDTDTEWMVSYLRE